VDTWLIGITVGSGVVFEGNRAEAQEHLDAYYRHLQAMFIEHGLQCIRKDYTIRLKDNNIVEPEDIDSSQNGNGVVPV
jgi:hypothetical protein